MRIMHQWRTGYPSGHEPIHADAASAARLETGAVPVFAAVALGLILLLAPAFAFPVARETEQPAAHSEPTAPISGNRARNPGTPSASVSAAGRSGIPVAGHRSSPSGRPATLEHPEASAPALVVSGTIVWSIIFANRAIISDPERRQHIYFVGDRLPDGSELAEIHPDEVIIRRDNRLVTLPLSGVASPEEVTPDNATLEPDVREVREILLEHPEILASVIEAEPTGGSGPGSGFRIIPGAARAFLAALGLEPGDIVSAVNGIALNSSEGAVHTLTSLAGAHVLELSIWRRGQLCLIDI